MIARITPPNLAADETCVLLVREWGEDADTVSIKVDLDGLNIKQEKQIAPEKGTYDNIKAYVKEKYGYKVSSIYIAQVKERAGIQKRENYNIGEGKGVVPHCPPEKEEAIKDALRHFGMIGLN